MKRTLLLCKSCLEEKGVSEFYFLKGRPQLSRCRPCKNQYQRDLLKDPEKLQRKRDQEKVSYEENRGERARQKKSLINTSRPHRMSVILQNSKTSAKKKGLAFSLTKDMLEDLYQLQGGNCALSGEVLEVTGDRYLSNLMSLDRIDSSLGYIEDNIQWVCVKYNMMKAHAKQEEFIEMCKKVVEKANA